jgi:hypothetical protein
MTWKQFNGFGTGGNPQDDFQDALAAFDAAPPAAEPLPPGKYEVHVLHGKLCRKGRKGTPAFEVKLQVRGGEFGGRFLWRDYYLTEAAVSRSARELVALNIKTKDDLRRGCPLGLVALAVVGLEVDEETSEQRNTVHKLTALRIEAPAADVFAPAAPQETVGDSPASEPRAAEGGANDAIPF